MVTIYDVAKAAGVSVATVSRVFAGNSHVSAGRKEAVEEAAKELGFVPNSMARRLRTQHSEVIALLVPDIENPFFTLIARAVEDVARERGYSVMLCNTDEDPERESEYLRVAASEPVAGIIIVPTSSVDLSLPLERGVPVVSVDRHAGSFDVDAVVADNAESSKRAAELLFDHGYSRVACITGPMGVETADERLRGWAEAVRERTGSEPKAELAKRASYSLEGGEEATRELLALPSPPDAIFAANNRLGAGALRALHEVDSLPPKVGVVSFGGLPLILLAPLGVLITHLPARELGKRAAEMLLERIDGLDIPARSEVLEVQVGGEDSGIELMYGQ
ncbi:MAG: LacI family transcriptional regulator [Propionibacteriaceae bacterium]|jgi:LacI family transcriptional regulator|nr:LacI family transcriptional regulator [Propionibacteriaceae bacterium]